MKKIIAIIGFLGVFASQTVISSAAYFNTTPVVVCDTHITQTLQMGSQGGEVYMLQTGLFSSGYLTATPNGYFGYQTDSAVRAFQRDNFIPSTGIVGPITRNALNESFCDTTPTGITYVTDNGYAPMQIDPIVRVVTPNPSTPNVYATPQSIQEAIISSPSQVLSYNQTPQSAPFTPTMTQPATGNGIVGTNIVYNPAMGYSYGIIPQSGSITVSSPVANAVYKEGDTVLVNFGTNNLRSGTFSILLENTITGQSKMVGTATNNSYSFVLGKELLDAICSGSCATQQGSYRIVVTTPTTDIAGITTTLRAAVAPITINRPIAIGQVSISTSKTPVNSEEIFKLYVNIPSGSPWFTGPSNGYTIKIRAICPSGVTASVAGTPCGQDFIFPFTATSFQQEIPAMISNTTWYRQDVIFQLTVTNSLGQVAGTGETKVTANAKAFSW